MVRVWCSIRELTEVKKLVDLFGLSYLQDVPWSIWLRAGVLDATDCAFNGFSYQPRIVWQCTLFLSWHHNQDGQLSVERIHPFWNTSTWKNFHKPSGILRRTSLPSLCTCLIQWKRIHSRSQEMILPSRRTWRIPRYPPLAFYLDLLSCKGLRFYSWSSQKRNQSQPLNN